MATKEPKPFTARQVRVGRAVEKWGGKLNTWVFRVSKGRIGGRFPGGAPVLLLTTTGRRSGLPRTQPLLYLDDPDRDRLVVVASQGGMPTHPDWYFNLLAEPAVTVELRGETRSLVARVVDPDEKAKLWPRLVAMYKGYDDYQARAGRDIPVVALELAS